MKAALLTALLASLLGGCGVLEVPTSQEYPGPVKSVCVRDARSGVLLEDAQVDLEIHRYENWLRTPARLSAAHRAELAKGVTDGAVDRLEAVRVRPGVFAFRSRTFRGTRVIWFPLPPVLGHALYKEHRGLLRVGAPGHAAVAFAYCPQAPPAVGVPYEADDGEPGRAQLRPDGALDVHLEPSVLDAGAAPDPRRSRGLNGSAAAP